MSSSVVALEPLVLNNMAARDNIAERFASCCAVRLNGESWGAESVGVFLAIDVHSWQGGLTGEAGYRPTAWSKILTLSIFFVAVQRSVVKLLWNFMQGRNSYNVLPRFACGVMPLDQRFRGCYPGRSLAISWK